MITYIIKSSLSLLLMFGLYWFLLRKEKLFVFNRFFLIVSIAFSLVLPLITIPVNFPIAPQLNEIIPSYNYVAPEVIVADNIVPSDLNISQPYVEKETTSINIFTILLLLYISGVIMFLIRFSRNIYLILRRSKISEKISSEGYRIVLTDDKTGPCCFFSNIFLNKDDYLNGKIDKELLNHELEHVRQSHTIDIILIELVKIFYWFNPIHLLYDRAIRINHEYLADNGVIIENSDIKSYTDKLLNFISCSSNMSLTSGSNNSFTKLRLMMMMKSRSGSFKYGARIAVTLCMGTVFFFFLSFEPSNAQPIISLTNQKDPIDTLLINDNSLETNMNILNHTPQSSNESKNKVSYSSSGYIKQDTINQIVVLVDNAKVCFGEITIKADSIVFNRRTNQIYAMGRQNSSGTVIGKPIFKEGSQEYVADEITFNLITRKAVVKNINAQVNTILKDSGSINMDSTHNQIYKTIRETSNTIEKPELFPIKKGEYSEIPVTFGEHRIKLNSKTDTVLFHYGIDIVAKFGTEVMATAGGNVINASWEKGENWGYGNLIMIDHGDGCQSLYGHLKDFNVKTGDSVKKGQIIGHVGSSGLSTGAHLHFEIRVKGERVNPLTYLK